MARIAGVNIPTGKRVEIALTYIHGIGRTKARQICESTGIPREHPLMPSGILGTVDRSDDLDRHDDQKAVELLTSLVGNENTIVQAEALERLYRVDRIDGDVALAGAATQPVGDVTEPIDLRGW